MNSRGIGHISRSGGHIAFSALASILLMPAFMIVMFGMNGLRHAVFDGAPGLAGQVAVLGISLLVPAGFGAYLGKRSPPGQTFLGRYLPLLAPAMLTVSALGVLVLSGHEVQPGWFWIACVSLAVHGLLCLSVALRCRGNPATERRRGAVILAALSLAVLLFLAALWSGQATDRSVLQNIQP